MYWKHPLSGADQSLNKVWKFPTPTFRLLTTRLNLLNNILNIYLVGKISIVLLRISYAFSSYLYTSERDIDALYRILFNSLNETSKRKFTIKNPKGIMSTE